MTSNRIPTLRTDQQPLAASARTHLETKPLARITNIIFLNLRLLMRSLQCSFLRLQLRYLVISHRKPLLKNLGRAMLGDKSLKPAKHFPEPFHDECVLTPNVDLSHSARQNETKP